jgi:hypothetical protein
MPVTTVLHSSDGQPTSIVTVLLTTDNFSIAIVTYCLWRRRTCSARHLKEEAAKDADRLVLSMVDNEEVVDEFKGSTVWWLAYSVPPPEDNLPYDYSGCATRVERRIYRFSFLDRDLMLREYLPHVRREGRVVMVQNRQASSSPMSPTGNLYD